jgi:transposase
MDKVGTGIDAGKEFHWVHIQDASGTQLLSRRVENDEAELVALIEEALSFAEDVLWAIDQPAGCATLLLALLWERGQRVLYVPGLTVDREPVMPTGVSPRPTPKTPASLPIKPV